MPRKAPVGHHPTLASRMYPPKDSEPYLTISLHTAMSVLALAEDLLAAIPSPAKAVEEGSRQAFGLLSAAEAAQGWLVGHGPDDHSGNPAPESAFGAYYSVLGWEKEDLEHRFQAAAGGPPEGEHPKTRAYNLTLTVTGSRFPSLAELEAAMFEAWPLRRLAEHLDGVSLAILHVEGAPRKPAAPSGG